MDKSWYSTNGPAISAYYHLRQTSKFLADPIHSVFDGSESASYMETKICEQVPSKIENINSLDGSKKKNI